MPSSPQDRAAPSRRNNIGTLRLAGALAVLLGHAFILSSANGRTRDDLSNAIGDVAPFNLGLPGIGVAMFFAISGYLVAQSYQRRGSALAYLEARLLRIYPALWVAIGLTIAVGAIVTIVSVGDYFSSKRTIQYAVGGASLLDVKYLLPGVFTGNPDDAVNGSLWTLPVELKMYAFIGVVGIAGILGRRALFNVATACLVVTVVAWPDFPPLSDPAHQEIATFFLAGSALFVNRDLIPLHGAGVIALAVLAATLSWTAAYPLVFAVAFSYAVLWLGFTRSLRLPDLTRHGDLSYGTYLFAFPVAQLWVSAVGPGSPWLIALLTAAVALPLAYGSWRAVEAPALRLKGRWARQGSRRRAITNVAQSPERE